MIRGLSIFMLIGFLLAGLSKSVVAAESFQVNPKSLADIQFVIPKNSAEQNYLGLSGGGTFSLPQVKAGTLVIEVFSMYCPFCQENARVVNQVHQLLQNDPSLERKVKVVGLGIGNTPFEVELFRKQFSIGFPLFADDNLQVQKVSEQPFRTPTFITANIEAGKGLKILDVHVGQIRSPEEFLTKLKKLVGGQ